MRNALAHAPAKQRSALAAMLRTIFAQETGADAVAQWDRRPDALREKQPKLGALMDASREDVLAYMTFPREHWPQIATTNPLERVNREIKRQGGRADHGHRVALREDRADGSWGRWLPFCGGRSKR